MSQMAWAALRAELDQWQAQGRSARLWLRDDDAVAPTPALEQLLALARRWQAPVLLAVIPALAQPELVQLLAQEPLITPCQHGYAHTNHAPAGEKKCELGAHRPLAAVLAELRAGQQRLRQLFGTRLAPVLVPPWNRMTPPLLPELPGLGFACLSTFGPPQGAAVLGLAQRNCDLDIIDWRGTRGGIDPAQLSLRLVAMLAASRETDARPIGVLTHHLVHDAVAWGWLEKLLAVINEHPAARCIDGAMPDVPT